MYGRGLAGRATKLAITPTKKKAGSRLVQRMVRAPALDPSGSEAEVEEPGYCSGGMERTSGPATPGPPDRQAPSERARRHRIVVWSLIGLASVLLVFSITANWVQLTILDTNEVVQTTDQILDDEDAQEQLSIYLVDQVYANVDVQGQLAQELPSSVQPLAAPIGAAARRLATSVAQEALASPQFQELISGAIGRAQERFVSLIRDEGAYVSTAGGEVTIEYGKAVADLAARLGLDPSTISEIQGIVQDFSADLSQGLTQAQDQIEALRSDLSQVEAGQLSPELRDKLQAFNGDAAELKKQIASLETKIKAAEGKLPDQLQGSVSELGDLLAGLDDELSVLVRRSAAALNDPSEQRAQGLDASLSTLEKSVTTLLDRQVVQNPGELVIMDSSQLDGVQSLFQALRNLGFVLPLLALLLYLAAIWLAKGWRREALIAVGGGILVTTLLVLAARRLLGNEVTSLASSQSVEPAVASVWDILSAGLRERALFVLVIGLAFVGGGLLAGPGRHASAVRRFLAPYLRDHPAAVYSVLAALFLLWLAFIPGIQNLGQVLVITALAVLAVVGVEVLRRQTAREFPAGTSSTG